MMYVIRMLNFDHNHIPLYPFPYTHLPIYLPIYLPWDSPLFTFYLYIKKTTQ
ncbi:hypothetical protein HanHA300_Chr17g0663591 [Helianthus annuus]|nr:hypothetical protein HanHA300_Chr17g0663591 [Helianthus annuus]KAJ0448410.1 hypothetical protein HanHA89_Chr17g0716531 [Helianthus annuus]KAJ0633298.1 hypothetical protein HanLR1_Chr17g0675071 [Helianthus annuus]